MREKKTFAQRTRTRNTDEVWKKYFLVYEGKETGFRYLVFYNYTARRPAC